MDAFVIAILAVLAAVIVSMVLGVVAFIRVRRWHGLAERLGRIETELAALRASAAPGDPASSSAQARATAPDGARQPPSPEPPTRGDEIEAGAQGASGAWTGVGPGAAAKPRPDIERTLGGLWAVWIGGAALALGGVFLVKYSIDQGWMGPAARILLGLLFGLVLAVAGEWTRRRGRTYAVAGFEPANVPAVLTAAGIVAGFASVYAAHALYALIGPTVAFLALGLIAVAGLGAALVHGRVLAALGIVASYAVPFLVETGQANPPALALYALAVSASAFGVARLRLWRWLAIAAAGGLFVFGLILLAVSGDHQRATVLLYLAAAWALVAYTLIVSLYPRDPDSFVPADRFATIALSLLLLLWLGAIVRDPYDAISMTGLVLAAMAPLALAFAYAAARYVVLAAIAVTALGYLSWSLSVDAIMAFTDDVGSSHGISTPLLQDLRAKSDGAFGWTGIVLAGLAAGTGYAGALRSSSRALMATAGTALPLALLAIAYLRLEHLQASLAFATAALALGGVSALLAGRIEARLPPQRVARAEAAAAYTVAAVAGIALAAAFALERGALTLTLALLVPVTALVHSRRRVDSLRPVTVALACLWIARVIWDPRIVGDDLGTVPLFNWLTYGYAVPAAGFIVAAQLLARVRRDLWLELIEAIAIAASVAAAALVGLHAIDPAAVFTPIDTLPEAALYSLVSGGVALALARLRRGRDSQVVFAAIPVLGFAGMTIAAFWLLVEFNPWLDGGAIGPGLFVNRLAFGYLAPAGLYLLLAAAGRSIKPAAFGTLSAALAFALFAAWLNLTIRHAFHPDGLHLGPTTDAELYVYSLAWLAVAIVLLAIGLIGGRRPVRLLSGVVLLGVIAKVFVIDMAGLTGALRAFSFIGLGVVLIAVGLSYQRLLRRAPDASRGPPDTL